MFTKLKSFLKTTAIYGVVGSTRSFIEFLLLPLYARFLTPGDFGTLDILMIYVMVGIVISVVEMNNAAFRFYYDQQNDNYHRKVISTSFSATSLLGISVFAVTYLFANNLSMAFFDSISYSRLFIVAGSIVMLNSIYTVPLNLLRIESKPVRYTAVSLLQIFLSIGLIIVFLSRFTLSVEGILLAKSLSMIPTVLICLYWARSRLRLVASIDMMKSMLKYSLPLIPVSIAIWGINSLNRLFMLHYLTLEQIGYFSLASKFVVVITLSVIAFQLAWPQFAFSNMNSKTASKTFSQVFNLTCALGIWLVVGITMYSGDFIKIAMGTEFYASTKAVLPLALGMFFYGVFYFFTTGAIIEKKTSTMLTPILTAVVFNIVLNLVITPVYGFNGTAWVTLSTYLVMAIIMYFKVRNSEYIKLDLIKIIKLTIVSAIFLPASFILAFENTISFMIIKAGMLLAFPIALLLIGFIDKKTTIAFSTVIGKKTNGKLHLVKKPDSDIMDENIEEVAETDAIEKELKV